MGEDLVIAVSLLQNISLNDVTLFYRVVGAISYREQLMEYRGGSWRGVIPTADLSLDGIEYLIVARAVNGSYFATPEQTPFETPHRLSITSSEIGGRHFPGSSRVADLGMVAADILILSPQNGEMVDPNEVVVAVSLFSAPNVDTSTIHIEVDGKDYTSKAIITSDIISLHPKEIQPGLHTIRIYMKTNYGMDIEPVIWSFGTSRDYKSVEERLSYSGEVNSRASSDRIESQVLNIGEISAKVEARTSWMRARTNLRLTSRESVYLQPLNRYGGEVRIGDYLRVQVGDFYPVHSPFILDGKRIRGVGVDVDLRWFRFQVASGEVNRAVQYQNQTDGAFIMEAATQDSTGKWTYPLLRTNYTFKRQLNAYRLSVDFLKRYNIGLSVLKSQDVISSVNKEVSGSYFTLDSTVAGSGSPIATGTYTYAGLLSATTDAGAIVDFPTTNWGEITPEENVVAGIEYHSVHDDNHLRIDFSLNLSLVNRNIWDGPMSRAEMDTALDDSLDGLIGVTYDEYGEIVGDPTPIDTSQIIDPMKYADIFTININMTPLLPFDYISYKDYPLATIINMPSTAYNFRIRGFYFKNNISFEYRQIGPEYESFGNPYLTSGIREIILGDRIMLLDNKLLINGSYKYQSNKILRTTVDPYNTKVITANISLAPSPEVPSITMNFQTSTKNNITTNNDTITVEGYDLREHTRTQNAMLSINFPFAVANMKHNLVINSYTIGNEDLIASERRGTSVFQPTDSKSITLNLNTRFSNLPLRTVLNYSTTNLATAALTSTGEYSPIEYSWHILGAQAVYSLLAEKLRLTGGFNYMKSAGYLLNNVYNLTLLADYRIMKNLTLSGNILLQLSQTPAFKDDGSDNDGDGKTDEFLEPVDLNSSTVNLNLNYRF